MAIKKTLNLLSEGILRPSNGKEIVMDDESYFTLSNEYLSGNDGFYSQHKLLISRSKVKFSDILLVWIAISGSGRSQAYFALRNLSITADSYSDSIKHIAVN